MFIKELTKERVQAIIEKIDLNLRKQVKSSSSRLSISQVVHSVVKTWTSEITEIMKDRGESRRSAN